MSHLFGTLVLIFMIFFIEIEAAGLKKITTKNLSSFKDKEDARSIILNATPRRRDIKMKNRALDLHRPIHQDLDLPNTSRQPGAGESSDSIKKSRENNGPFTTEGMSTRAIENGEIQQPNVPDLNLPINEEKQEIKHVKRRVMNLNKEPRRIPTTYQPQLSYALQKAYDIHRKPLNKRPDFHSQLKPFQDKQNLTLEKLRNDRECYEHFLEHYGESALSSPPYPEGHSERSGTYGYGASPYPTHQRGNYGGPESGSGK